ncbi:hypothetical protein SAMN02745121_08158 [Nannocystis exedens]|uniref:PEGA domain-containing protein n=1 Tax=Nannocystis exedens TaxID=54 RepID=A0A1I2HRK6_9BACT|nr:hypothetical protein [Nannocystis exedens]PCC69906.1 hypothetical protein NAEX_02933 [Nannocystis exedens]SFF32519.1 hypothetical protein SAMN02745121_08158 [Nannocystis exedens]
MVCVLLAALLLQAPTAPAASASPATPAAAAGASASPAASASKPGSADERRGRARAAFEHGRFAEAALEFEALWREGHGASDLFNAAASRFALRHHTHVVAHLEALLALPGLTAAQREEATALLRTARAETRQVPLELRAQRPLDAPLSVTLGFVSSFASDVRPDLTIAVRPGERTVLSLDPGVWQVRVDDPRFEPVQREVRVEASTTAPAVLELRQRQDARVLRRFALGWGVAGAAGVVVGASLLGVGQGRWSSRLDAPVEECQSGAPLFAVEACRRELGAAGTLRSWGAAVLGVGAGALIGGLVARVEEPRKRRVGWIVAASVGGLASIGGAVALGLGARAFDRHDGPDPWTADERRAVDGAGAAHTVGATFLGLGLGALASSVTGLVLDRTGRFLVSAGPQVRVGGGGLVLEGRF